MLTLQADQFTQEDAATAEQVKLTVLRMMKPQVATHTELQFWLVQAAAHLNCPVTPHTIVLGNGDDDLLFAMIVYCYNKKSLKYSYPILIFPKTQPPQPTPIHLYLSWSLMESKSSLTSTSISARYMEKMTTRQKRIGRNMVLWCSVNFLGMMDYCKLNIDIKQGTAGFNRRLNDI